MASCHLTASLLFSSGNGMMSRLFIFPALKILYFRWCNDDMLKRDKLFVEVLNMHYFAEFIQGSRALRDQQ